MYPTHTYTAESQVLSTRSANRPRRIGSGSGSGLGALVRSLARRLSLLTGRPVKTRSRALLVVVVVVVVMYRGSSVIVRGGLRRAAILECNHAAAAAPNI